MSYMEPWLRGTRAETDALRRQVLHALELAAEDIGRWCSGLRDEEIHVRPFGLASVAYQVRHTVLSLDRLLTYAEGGQLSEEQLTQLGTEMQAGAPMAEVFTEFDVGIARAIDRVLDFSPTSYEQVRGVGRKMLPTTAGGLLIHCAEHTQRHVGQAITTAKVIVAMRS